MSWTLAVESARFAIYDARRDEPSETRTLGDKVLSNRRPSALFLNAHKRGAPLIKSFLAATFLFAAASRYIASRVEKNGLRFESRRAVRKFQHHDTHTHTHTAWQAIPVSQVRGLINARQK